MAYQEMLPASGGGGSLTSLTPSNSSPATITSGNDYHAEANGVAIEILSNATPQSSPTSVSSGSIYKIGGSSGGYLINNYSSASLNPTSSGNRFYSGWNYMTDNGWAYSSQPSGGATNFSKVSISTSNKTATFSATSGALYIVLVGYHGTGTYTYNNWDGATCTGGSATKLGNLSSSNITGVAGTFYKVSASSSSVTLTCTQGINLAACYKAI